MEKQKHEIEIGSNLGCAIMLFIVCLMITLCSIFSNQ